MAGHTGIEPVIFSVTGRHVNRYTNDPDRDEVDQASKSILVIFSPCTVLKESGSFLLENRTITLVFICTLREVAQ